MKSLGWAAGVASGAVLVTVLSTACSPTFVVLPGPPGDTLVDTVEVDRVRSVVPRTERIPVGRDTVFRVDTVLRTDTVYRTLRAVRVDTVLRVDTIFRTRTVARVDTVVRVDTVRLASVDTVFVPARRLLFVPPGQYPPPGRCRIWIHGLAPGQQADPATCTDLGTIAPGAFILFGGDAWDFDYDWVAEAARNTGSVPPEILAVTRKGAP